MELSVFGRKFARNSGIVNLMDDLGSALLENPDMIMMGGGNPAYIPEIEIALQKRLKTLSDSTDNVRKLVGIRSPPLPWPLSRTGNSLICTRPPTHGFPRAATNTPIRLAPGTLTCLQ